MSSDSQPDATQPDTDSNPRRLTDADETFFVLPSSSDVNAAAKTPPSPLSDAPVVRVVSVPKPKETPSTSGYKLLSRLGGGTFGEVWKAQAPGGFPVAVKVIQRQLEDAQAQRELRSLEMMKELRHPYLLATHACWVEGGRLHIAVELADKTLRDRFNECHNLGGIPREELFRYFWEAAEALDFLHKNKVLHRDIKPDNLLLLAGHIKVADFGLARLQELGQSVQSSILCGTPSYMAPEVLDSKSCERSDLYSLAVSYVELRLGRRPFSGKTVMEMMKHHREGAPDLNGLPDAERLVLARALAAGPVQRYGSCMEFMQALRAALTGPSPGPIPSKPGPARLMSPPNSASLLNLVLVLIVVATLSFVAYYAYEHLTQPKPKPADPIKIAPTLRPVD